jgi:soluble lytic murein transglycosylase-like protein
MVYDRNNRQLNNLSAGRDNSLAAQAALKRPGSFRPQLLGSQALKAQGDSEFEAAMAMNRSQNSIISEVLDGPVSQQAQRQLAQLQAMNQKSHPLDDLAAAARGGPADAKGVAASAPGSLSAAASSGSLSKAAASAAASSSSASSIVRKGARSLLPGNTITPGAGKGKIFNSAQMAAYRQKNGYQLRMPSRPIALESARIMAQEKMEAAASMTESEAEALERLVRKSRDELSPGGAKDSRGMDPAEKEHIEAIIQKVSSALDMDPNLIKAVVKAESNYNPKAVSHAGAQGLMQLMPRTAKEMGVKDPFDPLQNIWGGARYLKSMMNRHGGNLNKALAAYNWGPGNLDRHGYGNGSNLPRETRRYIEVVNRNYNRYKTQTQTA